MNVLLSVLMETQDCEGISPSIFISFFLVHYIIHNIKAMCCKNHAIQLPKQLWSVEAWTSIVLHKSSTCPPQVLLMFYVISHTKTIAPDSLSPVSCEEGSPWIRFFQMSVPQVNYEHAIPSDLKKTWPNNLLPLLHSSSEAQGLQHYGWPLPE